MKGNLDMKNHKRVYCLSKMKESTCEIEVIQIMSTLILICHIQ